MRITEDLIYNAETILLETTIDGLKIADPDNIVFEADSFRYKLFAEFDSSFDINKFEEIVISKFDSALITLKLVCAIKHVSVMDNKVSANIIFADTKQNATLHHENEFITKHASFGIPLDALRKRVSIRGVNFTFVGIKPRARKNNMIIEDENGCEYVTTAEQIKKLI